MGHHRLEGTALTPNDQQQYDLWRGLKWPRQMPVHQRHLYLWKKHKEAPYNKADFLNPISEHLLEAGRMLFTPKQLVIHPWFEEMANDYTSNEGVVWWGAASCGKSHAMGFMLLMDYLTDPDNTYIMLASTTKPMLEIRSFASVVEYLGHLKANAKLHVPYKFIRQSMSVVPESADDSSVTSLKSIIRGVAILDGSQKDARAAVQGVHLKYVRIGADELSAMRPAILEARNNLAVCEDFKFIGAANPESLYDLCGQVSVPKDGWESVPLPETKTWVTTSGWRIRRFDAYDSPGLEHPEKYPFLPTRKTVERILRENRYNEDAPAVWTFIRGCPPPQGLTKTVMSETEARAWKVQQEVVWARKPTKVAALDPAFTADGDNAVLVLGEVGFTETGLLVLAYNKDPYYLKIEASSKVPVLEQLASQVCEILDREEIRNTHLGVDDSGTQSVADYLELRRGLGVYRCNFGSRPPELPVSVANLEMASVRYRDKVTWLYYTVVEYAQRGQVCRMPVEALRQICMRQLKPKLRPLQLESKADYKKRLRGQQSPDEMDACAILAGLVRERLGVLPGSSDWDPNGNRVLPDVGAAGSLFNPVLVRELNNLKTTY